MTGLLQIKRSRCFAVICAAALFLTVLALSSPGVHAADEEKKKTLNIAGFTTETAAAEETAKTIKADRLYRVKIPANDNHSFGSGFLSFTAPESGTWVIRLYGLKAKSGDYACGTVNILQPSADDDTALELRTVRTKGGYADTLYIATENSPGAATGTSCRVSRNAWLSLDKGQTVMLYFYFPVKSSLMLRAELS